MSARTAGDDDARESSVILECRFVKDLRSICDADESLPSTKILSCEGSGDDDDDVDADDDAET